MSEGIVYILTNPAMPGMVKIGKTSRGMSTRLTELYSTGVPLPFECAYAARVEDESKVERAFHQAFGPYRINPRREFFDIEPEQAIALLELMAVENLTPELRAEAEQVDVEAKAAADKLKRSRRLFELPRHWNRNWEHADLSRRHNNLHGAERPTSGVSRSWPFAFSNYR